MNLSQTLSMMLFMNDAELKSFAQSAPHRYKTYTIDKRNSDEKRVIAHPSKELKFVQRLIIKQLEKELPIHNAATAYVKGKSIKNNALPHANARYLLKMDLKNFFPSIRPELFFKECINQGINISDLDKELLRGFLFWKTRRSTKLSLSIGAPSSPLISNFILYRFDETISKICQAQGIRYTRYADDLTFSTNKRGVLLSFSPKVRKTLGELYDGNIKVNLKKTVISSKGHNRHVTGVTLTNDGKLSVGRENKRILSATIHRYSKDMLSNDEILSLKGKLSYFCFIEPELLEKLTSKYGHELMEKLKQYGKNKCSH